VAPADRADLVDNLTRGTPGSVKSVLASVVFALAAYQVVLAAIGYGRLRVLVGLACLAVFGVDDKAALHAAAGCWDRYSWRWRSLR
jgi:hypothetical protein